MVYEWKPGARIRANPQIAGDMCQKLESEGRLSAKNLLDENRPEDAPLHGEFEWNDTEAAEKYREQQARHIINSLVVCHEKAEPVRAYFKIETTENTYQSINVIFQNSDKAARLFEIAMRELVSIKNKYSRIERLSKVWGAIEEQEVTQ